MKQPSILRSKLYWVGVLYFAEGFPLGVFYELLPVHFRQQGVDLTEIGFLSLLGLAWSIKFLWAPAIDRYRHHRTWMLIVDLAMAAILFALAINNEFGPWIWVAVATFTLLSATNDVAIDGYTIELLDKNEFGVANGVRIGLYRVGLIATGGLLMLEEHIGWNGIFACAAIVMVLMGFACRAAPPELPGGGRTSTDARTELRAIISHPMVFAPGLLLLTALVVAVARVPLRMADSETLRNLSALMPAAAIALIAVALIWGYINRNRAGDSTEDLKSGPVFGAFMSMASRRYFFPVILFILTFKLADQTIGFMIKPFWVDAGFSAAQIGAVSVNLGIALSIAGGLAGGWFTDRYGVFTGLWVLGLTQIFSNLGYAWIAYVFPLPMEEIEQPLNHMVMMYSASAVESFTQGLGTGAFMAFLMSIVNRANAATEFAVLSSVFTLARSVAGWAGGYGAKYWGYDRFFLYTFIFGLPAYFLLPWVRKMLADAETLNQSDAHKS